MSGTMDPERLAKLRAEVGGVMTAYNQSVYNCEVEELLADRDHWEAEAQRWRARCPVTAEDVERAGVTWSHVVRWLDANGWAKKSGVGQAHGPGGPFVHWVRKKKKYASKDFVCVYKNEHAEDICRTIGSVARHHERPYHDILDEMAAVVSP